MLFYDTETCGFHGPTVIIQYAFDDGPIEIHNVWTEQIQDTIDLITEMMKHTNVGFNLTFDHFHLCQTLSVLELLGEQVGYNKYPEDYITEYALLEREAAVKSKALKPASAFDIMLHARKGPYQATMDRSDIRIKRVPTKLAWELAAELGERVPLKDLYFERLKDKTRRWVVHDIHDDVGNLVSEFKDILLKFAPSSGLKALAKDALGLDEPPLLFEMIELPDSARPKELGYAPYATAVGSPEDWKGAWPLHIRRHISHWTYNKLARKYAADDTDYTRRLFHFFSAVEAGCSDTEAREYANNADHGKYWSVLQTGDSDSVVACMVATVRWKGFEIDTEALTELRNKAVDQLGSGYNFGSNKVCRTYLEQVLDETERMALQIDGKTTTKGILLEQIAKWQIEKVCNDCMGMGCDKCSDGLIKTGDPHPAAIRAQEILDYRHAKKEIELYDKLLHAGRFHVSLNVIGALSGRLSGADGLNAQGIKKAKYVRRCFNLAGAGEQLDGGDFSSFQITIADAVYDDPALRAELLKGKKIHALFGEEFFPGKSYEEILATDGLPGELNLYGRSKNGVFALIFGGNEFTLATRVGIPEVVGKEAYDRFCQRFPIWGKNRARVFDMFCSMRQPGGIGTKVEWHEPAPYIESIFGFRRYFTLENMICKALFDIAEDPPKEWTGIKGKVVRRDREQTIAGAMRSACFAAAFNIQSSNMRAAANHEIQSPEASVVKELMVKIWELQPSGWEEWRVRPFSVHDEIMAIIHPDYSDPMKRIVDEFIVELRNKIPLAEMDWGQNLASWADK